LKNTQIDISRDTRAFSMKWRETTDEQPQLSPFENAAKSFLKSNPQLVPKFYSSSLLKTLVDAMRQSLPTTTAASICFKRLVANGLPRTDGKSDEDDHRAAVDRAQANLDKAIAEAEAVPLTPAELEYFGSLSQRELSSKYYGEDGSALNEFAVRYVRTDLQDQRATHRIEH
jgi:hypothetical protein